MTGPSGSRIARAVLLPLFIGAFLAIAVSAEPGEQLVSAELAAENASVQPGAPFWVAIRLTMAPEWHIYWRNSGTSGLPTTVAWTLPPGYTAEPLEWPVPARFSTADDVTFGYEGEAVLLARISPPRTALPGGTATLQATVSWLACRVECVPGGARLTLRLPVGPRASPPDARWSSLFASARARLPSREPGVRVSARDNGRMIELTARGWDAGRGAAGEAYFFPSVTGLVDPQAPQSLSRTSSGVSLSLARADGPAPAGGRLLGVLTMSPGARALSVDVPLGRGAAAGGSRAGGLPLLLAIAFAFIGGLILNLMPCVLPVLSLKVMSFIREAHAAPRRALAHGLVFTAGVLVSFWILLGVLLVVRAGGTLLGWGFQLQDPGIVAAMAVIMFVLGLNMLGVFEVGARAGSVGAGLRTRGGFAGSFFSGFLATIVATPCTAPFMGSALGFSFTQPPVSAFLVFTALAVGMSAPSLILSASPALLARVPKPGKWMETLKQALGFLMVATVVWLGYVLAAQAGAVPVAFLLGALAVSGLAAWIYGRWGTYERPPATRISVTAVAALLVAASIAASVWNAETGISDRKTARAAASAAVGASTAVGAGSAAVGAAASRGGESALISRAFGDAEADPGSVSAAGTGAAGAKSTPAAPASSAGPVTAAPAEGAWSAPAAEAGAWEEFSPQRLEDLRSQGRPVFIDFSAEWCLTCKVNERVTLRNPAVVRKLHELGVALLRADWTDRDDTIAGALAGFGRSGVPLYVYYGPNRGEPRVLPEILTPAIVLSAISGKG